MRSSVIEGILKSSYVEAQLARHQAERKRASTGTETHLRHKPEFSGVFPREIIHKLSMSQGKNEDEVEIDTLEN